MRYLPHIALLLLSNVYANTSKTHSSCNSRCDSQAEIKSNAGSTKENKNKPTRKQGMPLQNESYKNPAAIMPLEKDFIVNLKSPNPDDIRGAGFAKFRATLLLANASDGMEIESKLDIVRNVIADVTSGFLATELQGAQGRQKLASMIVKSLNSVLDNDKISAIVFPEFILQP